MSLDTFVYEIRQLAHSFVSTVSYPVSFDTSSLLSDVYNTLNNDLIQSREQYSTLISINNIKIENMNYQASLQAIKEELESVLFESLDMIADEKRNYENSTILEGVKSQNIITTIQKVIGDIPDILSDFEVQKTKCVNEIELKDAYMDYQKHVLSNLETVQHSVPSMTTMNTLSIANIENVGRTINIPMEIYEPVKELYWIIQDAHFYDKRNPFHKNLWTAFHTPGSMNDHSFKTARISFDSDQQSVYDAEFLHYIKPFYYKPTMCKHNIYNYPFALKPNEMQPSGSITPVAYSDFKFVLEMNEKIRTYQFVTVFAKVHNVFIIENGKGF